MSTDTVGAAQQAAAFDRFVDYSSCLRRQRGRILERNSCREPWSHATIVSVRQAIPAPHGTLEAELDVFNVLHLNGAWGQHVRGCSRTSRTRRPAGDIAAEVSVRLHTPNVADTPHRIAFQLELTLSCRF